MAIVTRVGWERSAASDGSASDEALVDREWLVTNGLGGYACGTLSGVTTRRYHGLLVAALPNPFGRTMMLDRLVEHVRLPDGTSWRLSGNETGEAEEGAPLPHGSDHLMQFRLELGLPVWTYRVGDF